MSKVQEVVEWGFAIILAQFFTIVDSKCASLMCDLSFIDRTRDGMFDTLPFVGTPEMAFQMSNF